MRSRSLWQVALLALAPLLFAPAPLLAAPQYVVEPCCQLCPKAADRSAYTTRLLQSVKTLIQGQDGWLFRTDDDLRAQFGPDAEGYANLRRLREALRARGVELVMVYQPTRGLMHPDKLPRLTRRAYNVQLARFSYGATLQRFRALGITVPPLDRLFREGGSAGYFFRGDHHWTPEGARRTARIVAETIRGMPVYASLPKSRFVTERSGVWSKRGTLQKAATQLCGFGYPDQFVPRFVTSTDAGGDLLGEGGVPPVTLVGTSNSDSAYNFAGFLSEELGVDILNESAAGGGHEGALLQYLPTEAFQKTPPKILVWELQTYHNLSKDLFYRQVVPLVRNGCATRRAALSRSVPLKSGNTEALFNGGGAVLSLQAGRHLLDLQFSDPGVKELKATVWYTNGSKETLSIEHSDHVDTGGRFVVELRDDPEWRDRVFLSLDVARPPGVASGTTLSSRICERADAAAPRPASKGRGKT